ncbi:uncharacterized protein LOC128756189 [Synchiropus splendidus]|uniref:uncharacterized protein LOC128756189 n=1 Tax=Synchiropus splendidus TaxID=270530 RepID=UPI00237D8EB7|nr:uncharacterized protein LOC128756189 [Synchiropus splendidus]
MWPHRSDRQPSVLYILLGLFFVPPNAADPSERARAPPSRQKRLVLPNSYMINFVRGQTQTVKVDWCDIADCQGDDKAWVRSIKYLCEVRGKDISWDDCPWHTGTEDWGVTYADSTDRRKRLSIVQQASDASCEPGQCNPLLITLKDPCHDDAGFYRLYAYVSGPDPYQLLYFVIEEPPNRSLSRALEGLRNLTEKLRPVRRPGEITGPVLSVLALLTIIGITAFCVVRRRHAENRLAQLQPTVSDAIPDLVNPPTNPHYREGNAVFIKTTSV